jgi:hypothetical protein
MNEDKMEKLLGELGKQIAEPVRTDLVEDIKNRIPHNLIPHKGGLDTINIIIHLKINKLTAAAAIIITVVLCLTFFGINSSEHDSLYEDFKVLVGYLPGAGAGRSDVLAGLSTYYNDQVSKGKDVEYYGDIIKPKDGTAVLMHWRLENGKYRVIFGDLHEGEVTAEQLIKLQARMLQSK